MISVIITSQLTGMGGKREYSTKSLNTQQRLGDERKLCIFTEPKVHDQKRLQGKGGEG